MDRHYKKYPQKLPLCFQGAAREGQKIFKTAQQGEKGHLICTGASGPGNKQKWMICESKDDKLSGIPDRGITPDSFRGGHDGCG